MADTEMVKSETEPVEEPTEPKEEIKEEIKVEGKDIVINGEKYDPERALKLIKTLRPFETTATKLQKKLDEIKQEEEERKKAELSEIDRLKLEKQEADQKLAELTRKELQREVAEKVKLPFALADRIKGETPEEMEADAKQLFESLPVKPTPKTGITNPGAQATEPTTQRLNSDINPFDPAWVRANGGGAIIKE